MFKIGVGPSSSHTLGPLKAALLFLKSLEVKNISKRVQKIQVLLYGSLSKTGRGHGTDVAIQLGLSGEDPVVFDVTKINTKLQEVQANNKIVLSGVNGIHLFY